MTSLIKGRYFAILSIEMQYVFHPTSSPVVITLIRDTAMMTRGAMYIMFPVVIDYSFKFKPSVDCFITVHVNVHQPIMFTISVK